MATLHEMTDFINAETDRKNILFIGLVRHLIYGDDNEMTAENAVELLHSSGHSLEQLQTVLGALVQRNDMQLELDSLSGCESEAAEMVERERILMVSFEQQQDQRSAAIDAATAALREIKIKVDRAELLRNTLAQLDVFQQE
jgi:hypothetical protein